MSTISLPDPASIPAGSSILIRNLTWADYEHWLDTIGDRPYRSNYDRGTLEIMSPSAEHDQNRSLLTRFLIAVTEELDIPAISLASTTWRREDLERGYEPDECFYLRENALALEGRLPDLSIDPPPDLMIEVEETRTLLDRLPILAALGVPEVWRFDGQMLRVLRLRSDRSYENVPASVAFPFLPLDQVSERLRAGRNTNQTRWGRDVRAWIRTLDA